MPKKKRKCCVCGKDLRGRNYTMIYDKQDNKIVVTCLDRRCQQAILSKGWPR